MHRHGFISVPDENNKGKYTNCSYQVKTSDDMESGYGIDGGRIIKLSIRTDDEIICRYDRGWDIEATTYEAKFALTILLHEFN